MQTCIERPRAARKPPLELLMLRVDVQSVRQSAMLHCWGRIVLGVEVEALRCMATARRERFVLLDLAKVHTIDAAGLGLLVELQCWALEHKRVLRILNPSECVRRMIALTRLHQVLPIAEASEAAPDMESDSDCNRRAMTA
ncbi:MAG: STAS domain-containing protein [Acidobacteriota bacterium]|nr:STAS domain-containing protein [Acidobacteriota bacterium]